jgi:CHAT domain-containing protein
LQAKIRSESPRYAALTQPQPLSLKEIQQLVVDDETLLLEYKLGAERSYLWAVTPDAFRSFDLPARAEVEKAARRVNELLFSLRSQSIEGETARQSSARLARAKADYPVATAQLSQMLLGPAADLLGKKRLLIVGDGALQYVPFAALPVVRDLKSQMPRPLIMDHEIINLPSASVLAVLRQEQKGRTQADASVAVMADPVFSADDVRLSKRGASSPANGDQKHKDQKETAAARYGSLQRSARDAGIDSFYRLRFSRDEAMAITSLLPADRALSALDFKASRQTAISPDLSRYQIVHFATHGLLNTEHPELSGLVLSLVDERGQPQDGFLRLHEVYSLKLGADLVVLSGCETALGKEMRGEGLIGLTRGFMYAGAPRVVASLWRVDDRATAELMKRFYEGMMKRGLRPAAAMRAAQVSMMKEARWRAPQDWAAFTIQGEWR